MNQEFEGHIIKRFDSELSHLHMKALEMGGLVVNQLQQVLDALKSKDFAVARTIVERDVSVDTLELEIDEEIIHIISRRCPVARDLRLIMAVSKMMTDLERVGDGAAKIAKLMLQLYDADSSMEPSDTLVRDIHKMGTHSVAMLQAALDAFDCLDLKKAQAVIADDAELDMDFQSNIRRLVTFVMEDARNVGYSIKIMLMMKTLERVGDHSKNIAEYVFHVAQGKDIRHQAKIERQAAKPRE